MCGDCPSRAKFHKLSRARGFPNRLFQLLGMMGGGSGQVLEILPAAVDAAETPPLNKRDEKRGDFQRGWDFKKGETLKEGDTLKD